MFTNKTVLPLFPCNVWVHELEPEVFEPMNAKLLARVEALLTPRPEIRPGFTWQTRNDLQDDPEFSQLVALFRTAFDGVLEFLQVEARAYEITGCWANVNPEGSPHSAHIHPNNYLSGVYFVRTSSGSDSITFHDPRAISSMVLPRFRERNQHNSDSLNVDAKVGRLAIFPAWLKHSVGPNQSPVERVSISLNMMFSDFTKTMSRPLWQGL